MSSPRSSLLLLDVVPKRGLLRSKRSRNDTIAHLRRHIATLRSMAPVDNTAAALATQRLPSAKSIDKRWDRSRSVILRNAERNVLRDVRWTLDDPVTFAETPASSREYATRRLIGGKPQATSTEDQAAPSNLMSNTNAISDVDPTFNLKIQLKEAHAEIRRLKEQMQLMSENRDEGYQNQVSNLNAREMRVKEYDNRVKEEERDVASRAKGLESRIADERAKALQDAQYAVIDKQRAVDKAWEDLRRAKEAEDAAQKKKRQSLKRREENIEIVEANARDNARRAEEAAYNDKRRNLEERIQVHEMDRADSESSKARFAIIVAESTAADRKALQQERIDFEKKKASFEEEKASFDSQIADAREAAKKDVEAQHEGLVESALQMESDAIKKRDEAADLRKLAIKIEQEAARTAKQIEQEAVEKTQSVWQSHQDAASRSAKAYLQSFAEHKEVLRKERTLEFTKFKKRLPNAEYREQVERQNYDSYQEIWEKLSQSASAFQRKIHIVYLLQRERVEHWGVLAKQFDGAKIHPSFPSQYRAICERIKEHLNSSQVRAKLAAERTKQDRTTLVMGVLQSALLQGHYSRVLTRFHRFGDYQGKAGMAEVMNLVFSEGPLQELRGDLGMRKSNIALQLQNGVSDGESEHLRAELVELDSGIAKINHEVRASALWRRLESLKVLRHDSIHEKEIAVTTNDSSYWINQASAKFSDFLDHNQSLVVDSDISEASQRRERDEISLRLRGARRDLAEYRTFIRERCVLQQQLGEVEVHNARLDAAIDREIESLRPRVLKKALASLPPPSSSRARPLAFRAARRSVAPVKGRAVPGAAWSTDRAAKNLGQDETSTGEVDHTVETPTQTLKQNTAYRTEQEVGQGKGLPERRKTTLLRRQLQILIGRRSVLCKNPKINAEKLSRVDENIKDLERSLAAASSGRFPSRAQRRAERFASSAKALPSSNSDSPKAPTANTHEVTAGPALNFTATPSQQSWQPLWLDQLRNLHKFDTKAKAASHGKNATMISRILSKPLEYEPFAPRALHVYAFHSLHTSAIDEQIQPDAQDSFRLPSNSDSPIMDTFDGSVELTQSSAEPISDPESDDSYEPSESGDSVCISETADLMTGPPDLEDPSSIPSTQEFADAVETQPFTPTIPAAAVDEQIDTQMTYNISTEDYRRAALASKSTNTAFWSYKLYKNTEGKTPTIHYCTNFETAEAQAKQFVDEAVLGFDLEWEIGSKPGTSRIKNCVSLVQIASETKIGLFQLAMFKGDKAEQLMPPSLRQILESRDIAKAGVNISGDANRIEKCFGFRMQGIFELSHLYNVVTWSETAPARVNKKLFKLADQVQNVLLLPMKKDAVRVSAWSRRLRPEQTEYAASDAYAGLRIYYALEARRKNMKPTPPRPAFWEEKKPLVLGDGTVVVPRTVVKKKTDDVGKAVDDEDDVESEEYFDAVETLDPYQLDSTAGVPLEALSISYPALPAIDESLDEPQQATEEEQQAPSSVGEPSTSTTTSAEPNKAPTKPRSAIPSSPAVTTADSWAQTFRNALPATHNLKSKHATLRAYHLWHHQSLECKDVAALLRDPPLSVMTVASYVLHAVSEESELACDVDRVVATLEILPASARGRYYRVVERVERAEVEREVARGFG